MSDGGPCSTRHRASLGLIRKAFTFAGITALAGQMVVDHSGSNLICSVLAAAAFISATLVCLRTIHAKRRTTLASALVFLAISANSIVPLFGTILERHALTYTLLVPQVVFFHRLLYAAVLLGVLSLLSVRQVQRPFRLADNLLRVGGLRRTLTPGDLWVVALVGHAALLANVAIFNQGGVVAKILAPISVLSAAPFLIWLPVYSRGWGGSISRKMVVPLAIYQIGLALVTNSRGMMILPIALLATAWLAVIIGGLTTVAPSVVRTAIVFGVALMLVSGQAADLSTAILANRAYRDQRTALEQLKGTWASFRDPSVLKAYRIANARAAGEKATDEWLENYIENPFVARFTSIKFDDNLFFRAQFFGALEDAALTRYTCEKLVCILPGPIISRLGMTIDKDDVISSSIGDYMITLAGRDNMGGKAVGSVLAHASRIWGRLYILPLAAAVFLLLGVVTCLGESAPQMWSNSAGRVVVHSPTTFGVLQGYPVFVLLIGDSVVDFAGFLLRGVWQDAIIFVVLSFIAVRVCGVFRSIALR